MTVPEPAGTAGSSLARDVAGAARYYLGGRRGLIVLSGAAVAAGLWLGWSWLAAAGIAPILVAVLPCVAMCALGLCMNRAGGKSCSTSANAREPAAPTDVPLPASQAVAPDVSPESTVGPLPGGAVAAPLADPEPQPPKERSTTDA